MAACEQNDQAQGGKGGADLVEKVAEAIFADIALPDAPWVDEWKARAPKAAIAVVLKDLYDHYDSPEVAKHIDDYARENGVSLNDR